MAPLSSTIYDDVPLQKVKFYQVCCFPNPKTDKFEIREVLIDGNNNVETYKLHHVSKKAQRQFLRATRDNKYRMYTVFTLEHIELPSYNDISLARSDMLNNDSEVSGYAPYN